MVKAIGVHRRGSAEADYRHRQHWIETMPCNNGCAGLPNRQGWHSRRRWHADGVQHRLDLRRRDDGHRGHEDLAHLARGDRRFGRAGRSRAYVRRHRSPSAPATRPCRACRWRFTRLNVPSIMIYGRHQSCRGLARQGSDDPDRLRGDRRHAAGKMRRRGPARPREPRLPGAGASGGQFTANTMAMAMEFIVLSPLGSASPACCRPAQGRRRPPGRRADHGRGSAGHARGTS